MCVLHHQGKDGRARFFSTMMLSRPSGLRTMAQRRGDTDLIEAMNAGTPRAKVFRKPERVNSLRPRGFPEGHNG